MGDGLVRIRARVERRRSRTRWMVPTAGAAAVAATVTAVVASGVLTGTKQTLQPNALGPVTLTGSSTPSASPAARHDPAHARRPWSRRRASASIAASAAPSVTDHDTSSAPTTTAPLIASDAVPDGADAGLAVRRRGGGDQVAEDGSRGRLAPEPGRHRASTSSTRSSWPAST